MKFLTDQDVYAVTARFLIGLGHDVVTAAQLGMAQAEDFELLERPGIERPGTFGISEIRNVPNLRVRMSPSRQRMPVRT